MALTRVLSKACLGFSSQLQPGGLRGEGPKACAKVCAGLREGDPGRRELSEA